MDELMEMYRQRDLAGEDQIDKSLLSKNNFSESQWLDFLSLVEDLDLNEEGARILLDEMRSGRVAVRV